MSYCVNSRKPIFSSFVTPTEIAGVDETVTQLGSDEFPVSQDNLGALSSEQFLHSECGGWLNFNICGGGAVGCLQTESSLSSVPWEPARFTKRLF